MADRDPPFIAARFESVEALCQGISELRDKGYTQLDAWLPFPNETVEEALALPTSNIPRWSAACGCFGAIAAYAVLYYTNVASFPVIVGGFEPHSPVAFLPITFETTILFSVLGGVGAFFLKTGLPRWYRPGFAAPNVECVSGDGFMLFVDASENIDTCEADVRALQPQSVHRVHP